MPPDVIDAVGGAISRRAGAGLRGAARCRMSAGRVSSRLDLFALGEPEDDESVRYRIVGAAQAGRQEHCLDAADRARSLGVGEPGGADRLLLPWAAAGDAEDQARRAERLLEVGQRGGARRIGERFQGPQRSFFLVREAVGLRHRLRQGVAVVEDAKRADRVLPVHGHPVARCGRHRREYESDSGEQTEAHWPDHVALHRLLVVGRPSVLAPCARRGVG